jgi:hypothetical protein
VALAIEENVALSRFTTVGISWPGRWLRGAPLCAARRSGAPSVDGARQRVKVFETNRAKR